MSAGMTVLPERSMCPTPGGGVTSPARPIRLMTPPSTTIAAFSIAGLPSPGMTRAPSNSTVWAGAGDGGAKVARVAKRPINAMNKGDMGHPLDGCRGDPLARSVATIRREGGFGRIQASAGHLSALRGYAIIIANVGDFSEHWGNRSA